MFDLNEYIRRHPEASLSIVDDCYVLFTGKKNHFDCRNGFFVCRENIAFDLNGNRFERNCDKSEAAMIIKDFECDGIKAFVGGTGPDKSGRSIREKNPNMVGIYIQSEEIE